jgi:hypothetical protein
MACGARTTGTSKHFLPLHAGVALTLFLFPRALSDPKPLVVGMEWVVQSAEKRNHEDETPYLIDMDDMNTTAVKVCLGLAIP